jgi:hypothetical protein
MPDEYAWSPIVYYLERRTRVAPFYAKAGSGRSQRGIRVRENLKYLIEPRDFEN